MDRTRFKFTSFAVLALLLFARPVSAGCAVDKDCCGRDSCECLISPDQCRAAVSQFLPAELETVFGLPSFPYVVSVIHRIAFSASSLERPYYFCLTSIKDHPPTGPPLI
jgi:hypothetical protein